MEFIYYQNGLEEEKHGIDVNSTVYFVQKNGHTIEVCFLRSGAIRIAADHDLNIAPVARNCINVEGI